jgi:phenylacetate-CoA ligase
VFERTLPVETMVSGITWPAIPPAPGAGALAMLFQLEQSQWWPPAVMCRHQFHQLAHVLDHAYRTVPFYRERLSALGWAPGRVLSPEHWLDMPLLSRREAQQAGQALQSNVLPPDHGPTALGLTSGSTGTPVQSTATAVTHFFWCCLTLREHLWHRRDFRQKLAVIRQFHGEEPLGPSGGGSDNWGPATRGVIRTGPCVSLGVEQGVAHQAEWLKQQAPGYLLSYPSNVHALAKWFAQRKERLPSLREVRTLGEVLEPHVRAACREAWGVGVVDMYSCVEAGYVALQCPEQLGYHVQSESLLVEILDAACRPCGPGQVGQLVLTTLHNFATPLLRYALGDYAQVGEPCPCGRGLPVLTRVLGRQRNMLTLPTGEQRWPSFGDPDTYREPLGDLPPVRQFQVIQRTVDTLEVKLVTPRPLRRDEEDRMRKYLHAALGYPFALSFTYVAEIPRSAGGKYEDFRSEL